MDPIPNPATITPDALASAAQIRALYLATLPDDYKYRISALADEGIISRLIHCASLGLTQTASAEAAGIHVATWLRWTREAEDNPDSPQAHLVDILKHARRQGQQVRLAKIIEHGNSDAKHWTALAWSLERTDQEQFALKRDTESGPRVLVQIGIKDSDVNVQVVTEEG